MYAGGLFTTINGVARASLAAIEIATGDVTAWDPSPDWNIASLRTLGGFVYVGGGYQTISGVAQEGVARFDPATDLLDDWRPDANWDVNDIALQGNTIFIGGLFNDVGGAFREHLAAITIPGGATSVDPIASAGGSGLRLGAPWPSPARNRSTVSLELPRTEPVTLDLFDVSGRRIASLLRETPLAAGRHEIEIPLEGVTAGVYFVRANAGAESVSRKVVRVP